MGTKSVQISPLNSVEQKINFHFYEYLLKEIDLKYIAFSASQK